jgi:hypothetical protein
MGVLGENIPQKYPRQNIPDKYPEKISLDKISLEKYSATTYPPCISIKNFTCQNSKKSIIHQKL